MVSPQHSEAPRFPVIARAGAKAGRNRETEMRKLFAIAGIAASLGAAALPANAGSKWSTYSRLSDSGHPMCGMQTLWNGAEFYVKYVDGEDRLMVSLYKAGWRFPNGGIEFPMHMQLYDQDTDRTMTIRWKDARGTMYQRNGRGSIVAYIDQKDTAQFLKMFGDADVMTINFDNGTEQPWVADMVGSRAAAQHFLVCKTNLDARASFQTQPY
jgi:hypothetical protein